MREEHRIAQHEPEYAAGGADGRNEGSRDLEHDELRDRGGDHACEVVDDVAPPAKHLLERAAEHVEPEHVERQVHQAAVQERVGDELPGRETGPVQISHSPPIGQSANPIESRGIAAARRYAATLRAISVAVTGACEFRKGSSLTGPAGGGSTDRMCRCRRAAHPQRRNPVTHRAHGRLLHRPASVVFR